MFRRTIQSIVMLLVLGSPVAAQVHPAFERGYDPAKSFPTAELDSVNLFNGNLTFSVPLAEYPVAGGLSYGLRLVYNSNVWDFDERYYKGQFVAAAKVSPGTNAGLGFRLHFGRLLPPVGSDDTLENQTSHWIYEGPDGSRHSFVERLHVGEDVDQGIFYTRDGSYLRLKVTSLTEQEVHFPDGTAHTVTRMLRSGSHVHRVTTIDDPHGNSVSFAYSSNDRTWTVTDDRNRTHTVTLSPIQPGLPPMVTKVELESFGGATATWTFTYQTAQLPVPCQNSDPAVTQVPVPLLTAINGPETLTYSMPSSSYADTSCTGGQAGPSGPLERLDLPTDGAIEWDYGRYLLGGDGTAGSGGGPLGGKPELHIRSSEGVVERRLVDGSTTVGSWRYTPSFEQVTQADGTLLVTERRTTVRDPLEHQRVHYFSAAVETTQTGGWTPYEYSLPFTRDASRSGRFLSREVFDKTGTRLRSVYVGHEMDPLDPHTPTVNLWDRNRREQSTETVYHDDGNRWASVHRSDFDGLGHYRMTTTGGNFGEGDIKTTTRDWNPSRGTFGQSGYSPFPEGSRWLLGTYGEERVTEGGHTFVRQTCFDESTGLLLRERIQEASGRRAGDIIRRYTYNGAGQRTRTEQFGGDGQTVSTSSNLCSLGLPSPLYRQHHTSQHGVLATTTWTQPNGTPLTWKTLDLTIDRSTGLPSASRDTAGFQTIYSWDRLGRLTAMIPAEGAWTETTYSFPAGSLPARVQVRMKSGSVTLTDEEVRFDPFGRLALERRRMPDGGWAERATATDALGNATSQSEWGDLTATTQFLTYDPFGRPARIRPPEGSSHDVVLWYSGVRSKTTVSKRATARTAQGDIVESDVQHTEITDRQGRLWKVREPEWPAGSGDRPETVYEYDAADRLIRVEMGGDGAVQPPPPEPDLLLFADGFEGGDLRCWKRVVGGAAQNVGTGGPSCSGPAALAKVQATQMTVTQERKFEYDGRGFLLSESHPELSTPTTYGDYDPLGNPHTFTRGGVTLETTYDRAGRPLLTSQDIATPGGTFARPWKEWTYSDGNFSGHGTRSQGKLATAVRHNWVVPPGGSSEIDLVATEHYVYSGLAGRTSQVRTSLNTSGYEWRTNFGYDALGDISSITYPNCVSGPCQAEDALRTVTFGRTRGLLTSVPGYATSLTYHDNGMVASVTHANNVVDTQTVDPSGRARPGSLTSRLGTTTLWATGAYSYDGSGNITKIGNQDWYLYDPLGRLSQSSQHAADGQTYAQSFSYDRFGNLLSIGPRTFGVDSSTNRLTTAAYDASGAVTSWAGQTFERDPFDMVRASEDWIYIYGPGDERLWTIHAPTPQGSSWTETFTLRGLGAEMLREYELDGGTVSGTWSETDTVHRDGRVLAVVSPSETQHASLDHLGTPRLWTGPGGVVRKRPEHLPYGEPAVSSDQKLQFTGHERDERGAGTTDDLDYMHARYYSPHLGRFLAVDPVEGNLHAPQTWNRYQYAVGSPVNYLDPYGRVELHFTFNAFIPMDEVSVPLVGVFEGDQSGFSAERTGARIQHRFTVETDPSIAANPLVESVVTIGPTRKIVNGVPGPPAMASQANISVSGLRLFDGTILINVRGHANNPLVLGSPAIDYRYRLAITPDGKVICLTCHHDRFPSYDGYLTVGSGHPQPLFQHEAAEGRFGPFGLLPFLPSRSISGVLFEFDGERWIDGVFIP